MELKSDCIVCDTVPIEEIVTKTIDTTLCQPCVTVEEIIPIVKTQLIENYCLSNFLNELVHIKNCNKVPRGC